MKHLRTTGMRNIPINTKEEAVGIFLLCAGIILFICGGGWILGKIHYGSPVDDRKMLLIANVYDHYPAFRNRIKEGFADGVFTNEEFYDLRNKLEDRLEEQNRILLQRKAERMSK